MKVFNKKLRKLKNDPKLFLKDFLAKNDLNNMNLNQLKKELLWKKEVSFGREKGNFNYTIISAVFNNEKYLDTYFKSIIGQSLNFKKNIKIILVDDGSTDKSAKIINAWQKKFPDNIFYIYQLNSGQAAARNNGLDYVNDGWVTFIDADDFIDKNYFLHIDNALKDESIKFFASKMIIYIENNDSFSDTQNLSYCFKDNIYKVSAKDLKDKIQLSASSATFEVKTIKENNLYFNTFIKPNFEDGNFVLNYLHTIKNYNAWFSPDSIYYYRVREDNSSTTNNQWKVKEKYLNVFEYGFIPTLKMYNTENGIPKYIQRAILHYLIQYIKNILSVPDNLSILNIEEKNKFLTNLKQAFYYIDASTIFSFNQSGNNYFYKVGMLEFFNKKSSDYKQVYVTGYDETKNLIRLKIIGKENFSICINDVEEFPYFTKIIKHYFADEVFTLEKILWIPGNLENDKLTVKINGVNAKIVYNKSFDKELNLNNSWVFIDQDVKADDNAEHLYRYVKNKYSYITTYFLLRKDSKDWDRLWNEGFNLVDFDSQDAKDILENASKIISSHADSYLNKYFNKFNNKKFIFLQHGVIKDDLSKWLNTRDFISLFVTSTLEEYKSIALSSESKYIFTTKEVVLTGLPRYDKLLEHSVSKKKILIMPTWRSSIVGKTLPNSSLREFNPEFFNSQFANFWGKLLYSSELYDLCKLYDYEVFLLPHFNIEVYLKLLNIPSYINLLSYENLDIQKIFKEASLLITDYSSVAFDFAILDKPIIYYQFDIDEIFNGSHTYQQGYFNYSESAFGDIAYDYNQLINYIKICLKTDCMQSVKYHNRVEETFKYKDLNNCERVYKSIIQLDEKSYQIDESSILDHIKLSLEQGTYSEITNRANKGLIIAIENQFKNLMFFCLKLLIGFKIKELDFDSLKDYFEKFYNEGFSSEEIDSYYIIYQFHNKKWTDILKRSSLNSETYFLLLAHKEPISLERISKFMDHDRALLIYNFSNKNFIGYCSHFKKSNLPDMYLFYEAMNLFSLYMLKEYDEFINIINKNNFLKRSTYVNFLLVKVAFIRDEYLNVINYYENINFSYDHFEENLDIYVISIFKSMLSLTKYQEQLFDILLSDDNSYQKYSLPIFLYFYMKNSWNKAAYYIDYLSDEQSVVFSYEIAKVMMKTGRLLDSYNVVRNWDIYQITNLKQIEFAANLAIIFKNNEYALKCYKYLFVSSDDYCNSEYAFIIDKLNDINSLV